MRGAALSEMLSARGRLNALKRHRDPSDPAVSLAQRDLRAARLADHIRQVVDEAPPLTPEQIKAQEKRARKAAKRAS